MKLGASANVDQHLYKLQKSEEKKMEGIKDLLWELCPVFERWLRTTLQEEVIKAIETERQKAKPAKNYTRDEVCRIAHISKPTLWKKTKDGEIDAIKVGRRVLYSESEVKRLIGQL